MFKIGIITASDKGSRGEREDLSAPVIREEVSHLGEVVEYTIVPDEQNLLEAAMIEFCDVKGVDLIFTTGGTGFSPRDVTPEATMAVIDRHVPGLGEVMRLESLKITPKAMLSRATAGIRKQTLIVNLPGSPKAVRECLRAIMPALSHGMDILKGRAGECARKE
ncbi:molybdopterin adenylyltransferase [Zhaonella formicivorans]|uniref:molybdopterin adenylyltransferase n=1 Tax=Zhaonella formicivorans TaxID=2528593 RepID=UPI0010E614B7|nr:molybdopterin adenylyltransferase [Zhaonella formicivorans]